MAEPPTTSPQAGGDFQSEAARVWAAMPRKAVFLALLGAWVALFHWQGNSTLGYVRTPSLFLWMENAWRSNADDQHGYFIPLVVLALLWWRRDELLALPKRPWWPALALVKLMISLHAAGFVLQQARVSVVAFFAGLWAITGLMWGAAWLRATFFPFVMFAFCVPMANVGDAATFPLRLLATKITVALSHVFLGLDVTQSGTAIVDPAGRFHYEVAAACSGIRSLTAIAAIAAVYGFVRFRRPWKRAVLILSAVPIAVAANVLRLLCIIIAADAFGQKAGNAVHTSPWLSLLPYVPAMAGVFALGRWLREDGADGTGGAGASGRPAEPAPADSAAPVPAGRLALLAVSVLVLIGLTSAFLHRQRTNQKLAAPGVKLVAAPVRGEGGQIIATNTVALPERVLDYTSAPVPVPAVVHTMLPKDTVFAHRVYTARDGFKVDSQVVLMGADRTSLHQPQYCLTGSGWQIDSSDTTSVAMTLPRAYNLPVMRLRLSGRFRDERGVPVARGGVFVYWFVADGAVTADHRERMWSGALQQLRTGLVQRWAYVICFASCAPGAEEATFARLKDFIAASVPEFQLAAGPPLN